MLTTHHQGRELTLTFHISIEIQLRDIIRGGSFNPDRLPDSTTWRIKDVTGEVCLFANGDDIVSRVCGVVDEHEQFILLAWLHKLSHVQSEVEVSSTIEASLLAVDEDSSFIVDGSKIEQYLLPIPVRGNLERI